MISKIDNKNQGNIYMMAKKGCWAQSAVNSMLQETPIYLRDEKPVDDLLT